MTLAPIPGSPEHRRLMTASKAAAVLGVSPWQSPYSLWAEMVGLVEPEPMNTAQSRGHYLEPSILAWWRDQHDIAPDWPEYDEQVWHTHEHWAGCTVDADTILDGDAVIVEAKSAVSFDDWGAPGTDEIPAYYLAQILFQLAVTGASRCYLPVFGGRLEFREYVIEADHDEQGRVLAACRRFWDNAQDPNNPPALDSHTATYATVRKQHPDIDDQSVEVAEDIAAEYLAASLAAKAAETADRLNKTRLLDAMGRARRAELNGQVIAVRQPNKYGVSLVRKATAVDTKGEVA